MKVWITLVAFCLSFHLGAKSPWSPIPPEVWAIKQGPKGALVLEEHLRFQPLEMETIYRVRIFAEEGRGAAELPDVPTSAIEIRGRTVYPDGREITFDSRKDFAERKIESGGRTDSKVHLVVPGVTPDCVVEVRWRERADGYLSALPKRLLNGLYGRWWLGSAYPTEKAIVEVAKRFPLAHTITQNTLLKAEVKEEGGFRVITYRNLPAREEQPYSLIHTTVFPRLEIFWQPDDLVRAYYNGRDAYWSEVFDKVYREDYEKSVDMGRRFRQFSEELLRGLAGSPQAKATEILARLESRIKNVSSPTAAERAALPKDFWEDYSYKRLDKAVATGMTGASGMRLMYYHLLRAAGIAPKIGKLVDREQDRFDFGRLNPWQFDHDVLGIEEAGKGILWIDPTNRFASPGVIHPDYQDTAMLVYEPSGPESWKAVAATLPAPDQGSNLRTFAYTLHVGEEADQFELKAEFAGYPEFAERSRFLPMSLAEQTRSLKEQFEKDRKNLTVSRASVSDVSDPSRRSGWVVEGSLSRESGRRLEVEPFPGMPWPLWIPAKVDDARTVPIVLPYRVIHRSVSTVEVPQGFRFDPPLEFRARNRFGSVLWTSSYDPSTRKATISLTAEVTSVREGREQWRAFKTYLSWIEEACRRTIVLTKEG